MKKTVKAILIGAMAIMLLFPSLSLAKGIKVGFKIGLNNTDLYGETIKQQEEDSGEKFKSKWGLSAGGFIRLSISRAFVIQPEVLYIVKGGKIEGMIPGEGIARWEFNLSYVEVPVLIKFMIPTPGSVRPNLYAGPAVAIKLSAKGKLETPIATVESDIDDIKDTDFGLIAGVGVEFWKLMVDVRYVLGLTTTSEVTGEDAKNRVISLSVGYSFQP